MSQMSLWDKKHSESYSNVFEPTELGQKAVTIFQRYGARSVLELGCGRSGDALLFRSKGFRVIASDISMVALASLAQKASQLDVSEKAVLQLVQLDIAASLPFGDECIDAIFSRLSIHYFSDAVTEKIVAELYRVLKKGGCLIFNAKSTEEERYDQGLLIERNVFLLNGHTRHFFSQDYVLKKLAQFSERSVASSVILSGEGIERPVIEAVAVK